MVGHAGTRSFVCPLHSSLPHSIIRDFIDPGNGTQPKVYAHMEKLHEDLQARHENQSAAFPRVDYPDSRKQGFVVVPEPSPEIVVQQHFMPAQAQPKLEAKASKPVTADSCPVGGEPAQSSRF